VVEPDETADCDWAALLDMLALPAPVEDTEALLEPVPVTDATEAVEFALARPD